MLEGSAVNPLEQRPKKSAVPQLALIVVLVAVLAVAAWFTLQPELEIPAEDWVAYESPSGGFSVRFPREPDLDEREMEGSDDGLQLITAELPSRVYAVTYNDCAADEVKTFGADRLLDYAMQAGTDAIGGTITKSESLTWNSHPGREFWADVPGGKAHYRIYLVGLRLYRLAIIHAPEFEANHEEFFGSFTVK